jgi:hypothetical protein
MPRPGLWVAVQSWKRSRSKHRSESCRTVASECRAVRSLIPSTTIPRAAAGLCVADIYRSHAAIGIAARIVSGFFRPSAATAFVAGITTKVPDAI